MPDTPSPFPTKKPPDDGSVLPGSPQWASDIKQMYNNVAAEPIPVDFQSLMDKIAKKIAK